jgi:hypothetical protein
MSKKTTTKKFPIKSSDPRPNVGSLIVAKLPGKRCWMVAILSHVYEGDGIQACAGDLVWDVPPMSGWMVSMRNRSKSLGQFIGRTFKSPEEAYEAMAPFVARGNQ